MRLNHKNAIIKMDEPGRRTLSPFSVSLLAVAVLFVAFWLFMSCAYGSWISSLRYYGFSCI